MNITTINKSQTLTWFLISSNYKVLKEEFESCFHQSSCIWKRKERRKLSLKINKTFLLTFFSNSKDFPIELVKSPIRSSPNSYFFKNKKSIIKFDTIKIIVLHVCQWRKSSELPRNSFDSVSFQISIQIKRLTKEISKKKDKTYKSCNFDNFPSSDGTLSSSLL